VIAAACDDFGGRTSHYTDIVGSGWGIPCPPPAFAPVTSPLRRQCISGPGKGGCERHRNSERASVEVSCADGFHGCVFSRITQDLFRGSPGSRTGDASRPRGRPRRMDRLSAASPRRAEETGKGCRHGRPRPRKCRRNCASAWLTSVASGRGVIALWGGTTCGSPPTIDIQVRRSDRADCPRSSCRARHRGCAPHEVDAPRLAARSVALR
jgi:hypothetical protein